MKVPNWFYIELVIGGTGGLTLLLTLLLSFVFFYAFQRYSDYYVFLVLIAPFFISLPTAYAILSRRYNSPAQRRLLTSILVSFIGTIMFLSGISVYYSSFIPDPIEALIGLIGFLLMLIGFPLALPNKTANGVLRDLPTQPVHTDTSRERNCGYLPAAGVATLLATILTSLVTFLAIVTTLGSCYSVPPGCSISMTILGILSAIGVTVGIAATSALLKGRYRRTVPVGLLFLTLSPLLIIAKWDYWFLLAMSILTLCVFGVALTAYNQKDSMKASDWRALGILSASLGAIALVSDTLQFASGTWDACQTIIVRPYFNNYGLLLSLGASGITFALISLDSTRVNSVKPNGFLTAGKGKERRSMLFQVSILLLTASIASTTFFSAAVIAPSLNRCNPFCYTVEQLQITAAIFGPSANQVTFALANSGTSDVTLSEALVQGGAISNPTYTSQLCTSTIRAGTSTTLVVTFQGVSFVQGTTYSLQLVSTKGHTFPYSTTA